MFYIILRVVLTTCTCSKILYDFPLNQNAKLNSVVFHKRHQVHLNLQNYG